MEYPKGLTLIELLMALASTLFLLLTLATMLITLQKNFNAQDAINSIQENALMAIRFLQAGIHQAGNIGCAKLEMSFPVKGLTPQNRLFGDDRIITVRGGSLVNAGLIKSMNDKHIIYVTGKPDFLAGDMVMIADCETAEIFKIKTSAAFPYGRRIESLTALDKNYNETASVSYFEINTFLIEDTGRHDRAGRKITGLYIKNINGRKTELVEGIDDLTFSYDIKKDKRLFTVAADQITDWSTVAGIDVHFNVVHFPYKKPWDTYIAL